MSRAYNRATEDVVSSLDVDPHQGLSDRVVTRRRDQHGENRLRKAQRKSSVTILVEQFKSLIIGILVVAAVLSAFISELVQAAAILVAVLVNTGIGFFTELKAQRSMEALRELGKAQARVRRGGRERTVEAVDLVPGDIVLLKAGEVVPADLRLLEADSLQMNESALTGESVPVSKATDPIEGEPALAERRNLAFKGTAVSKGSGSGVVVATGMDTEVGHISELAETAEGGRTPLEKRLDQLGRRLLVVIAIVAVVVAVIGIVSGRDLLLMVETGIALVVAAVPEGLPIVASIALARGMWRLAERNALIEKLSAVETLGATNIIATDKTGTLTLNQMTLQRMALPAGSVEIRKEEQRCAFKLDGADVNPSEQDNLRAALEVGVLCNAADLSGSSDEDERSKGDPMEVALLAAGKRAGIERGELIGRFEEIRREEFDPEVKMMATFHRTDAGIRVAVKGAPETVIDACNRTMTDDSTTGDLDDDQRKAWHERNDQLAGEGLRVLAVAQKSVDAEDAAPYEDLTLIGLVGLLDPAREDVRDAVLQCREAGIKVVMVTGDQPETARAIAETVGLVDKAAKARVILGSEVRQLEDLSCDERHALMETAIFARFSPEQKLNLVKFYQDQGLVVAMTGDGINDAPALKTADIGVAMGQRGTEVAREAADMVLRDDSFASIVAAVRLGRTIFGNIRKFVLYMLSGNAGEIFAVSLLALTTAPLPLLPLQILYINVVSDVFPALALGVGESRGDVMRRPPRDPEEQILTRQLWYAIAAYGVLIGGTVLVVFGCAFVLGMSETEAVTVSFLAFGFARLWHVFNMRDPDTTLWRNEVAANLYVWGALGIGIGLLLAAAYLSVLNTVLQTTPPSAHAWLLILTGSLVPLAVGQVFKLEAVRRLVLKRLT